MLTYLDKFVDLIEKRENFAVSLRKKKKQDTLSTKRRAY
jgi:hypothetical protein